MNPLEKLEQAQQNLSAAQEEVVESFLDYALAEGREFSSKHYMDEIEPHDWIFYAITRRQVVQTLIEHYDLLAPQIKNLLAKRVPRSDMHTKKMFELFQRSDLNDGYQQGIEASELHDMLEYNRMASKVDSPAWAIDLLRARLGYLLILQEREDEKLASSFIFSK